MRQTQDEMSEKSEDQAVMRMVVKNTATSTWKQQVSNVCLHQCVKWTQSSDSCKESSEEESEK